MIKQITVPKGKDLVNLAVTGHSYLRLIDAAGKETFRFDSSGVQVTAVVQPGTYTVETDGKIGKVDFSSLDHPAMQAARAADAAHPPMPND